MPVRCLPLLKVIASTIFFIGLINPTVWAQSPRTPGTISLHGAGSTFAAPLYKKWIEGYASSQPSVSISYDVVGSGEGVRRFLVDAVDFAGSDEILTDSESAQAGGAIMIPVTAGMVVSKLSPLTWPRYPLLGLPEFGTVAALDHYNLRKRKAIGDFVELRAHTREHINALMPDLEELDHLVESSVAVNGELSLDDVRVLPLLRSAAVVKGLRFPKKVRDYFEMMMSHIGYVPLATV